MPKKLTTEEFINRSVVANNNKYDYSETTYVNQTTKVKIICPIHGEFEQNPDTHMQGRGCYKCGKIESGRKQSEKSKSLFKTNAAKVHGSRYNYDLVEYVNSKTPIKILCKKHGVFLQAPHTHLAGSGCLQCSIEESHQLSIEKARASFKDRSTVAHGDKYDYSKVNYINAQEKVEIICKTHGSFWQRPADHTRGFGCRKCATEVFAKSQLQGNLESFILEARKVHGDKYSYTSVDYRGLTSKVEIICNVHGVFTQLPSMHLAGQGCIKCFCDAKISKYGKSFVERAEEIHGKRYDYSTSNYTGSSRKVDIVCKEHGIFSQSADSHLKGHGCPNCPSKGFIRNKHSFLYVLETSGGFVGFGISGSLNKRITTHKRNLRVKGIDINNATIFSGVGEDVFQAEAYIKKNFANSTVSIEGFRTEAFSYDRLNKVLVYLNSNEKLKKETLALI